MRSHERPTERELWDTFDFWLDGMVSGRTHVIPSCGILWPDVVDALEAIGMSLDPKSPELIAAAKAAFAEQMERGNYVRTKPHEGGVGDQQTP